VQFATKQYHFGIVKQKEDFVGTPAIAKYLKA